MHAGILFEGKVCPFFIILWRRNSMNEIMEKEINIENMIYEINGVEVMLDSDLAELYHVETKRINEAVYRNQQKFPKRISWVISDNEKDSLWSQNATANISKKSRVNPRVFYGTRCLYACYCIKIKSSY
jgi:hypothetical protein